MVCFQDLAKHIQPRSFYNAIVRKKEVVLEFLLGQMMGNWQICF